ncbi:PTS sugar transporter subunit IIA [Herbidospora cretacea]|uniref:PTS sugar transporter subunit IIA n=1 Tax=Herbidospora cretacea TaxID=28444 RepID=UPI0004C3DCD5|nr:PTS sugar transporter subunit IIA [Herbidospora cretacea]
MADIPLDPGAIRLDCVAVDRDDAIRQCGETLVAVGAAAEPYIAAMLERERTLSTYVGEGVAIPHGTLQAKEVVHRDAVCVLRFPAGVDWDGERVNLCVGIAAKGDGHVRLLAELAEILMDPDAAEALRETADEAEVRRLLMEGTE